MVAAEDELNHLATLSTSTPTLVFRKVECSLNLFVCWTIASMRGCFAYRASSVMALRTCSDVAGDVNATDEGRTVCFMAVGTILRAELLSFLLEISLELVVNDEPDTSPRHFLLTTSRRIESLVLHSRAVELFYTCDTIVVAARCWVEHLLQRMTIFACYASDVLRFLLLTESRHRHRHGQVGDILFIWIALVDLVAQAFDGLFIQRRTCGHRCCHGRR